MAIARIRSKPGHDFKLEDRYLQRDLSNTANRFKKRLIIISIFFSISLISNILLLLKINNYI